MTPRPARPLAVLLALALAVGVGHSAAAPAAAVDGQSYVTLANQKRASVGKPPVSLVGILETISHERASQLASTDVFEHDMAYVSGRLRAAGVCITGLGEIIAWERGYATYDPARTIEAWWQSPGHHAIMVGDYNAAGGSHKTSSTSNKLYSVMVWVKLCTPPPPPTGTSETDITRLAGADRYATAAAISRARFAPGVPFVYVATGANYPDALAGAAAAAKAGGPVLLTHGSWLSAPTATELARLRPGRIIILGGTGAVTARVADQLRAYAPITRIAGASRYETAAALSRASFGERLQVAYIATGDSFPDALAGGALAGRDGAPVLLVTRSSIPDATRAELARLRPGRINVLGGPGAVSDAVVRALRGYATSGTVNRLAGADRFATSVAVSRAAYGGGADAAFIATGFAFPDGLAGGPVAALVPGPVLLVKPTDLPSNVAGELARLGPDDVFVLGSTGAVSNGVVNEINAALP